MRVFFQYSHAEQVAVLDVAANSARNQFFDEKWRHDQTKAELREALYLLHLATSKQSYRYHALRFLKTAGCQL